MHEITEETALDPHSMFLQSLGTVYLRFPEIDFTYHMFGIQLEGDRPAIIVNPDEHMGYAWRSLKEGLSRP